MSLDIYFHQTEQCPHCGEVIDSKKEVYQSNMTHNVHKMVEVACGKDVVWHPKDNGIEKAGDLIPYLEAGINELIQHPQAYRQFEPDNGWGSVRTTIPWLREMKEAAEQYPEALIQVSR